MSLVSDFGGDIRISDYVHYRPLNINKNLTCFICILQTLSCNPFAWKNYTKIIYE